MKVVINAIGMCKLPPVVSSINMRVDRLAFQEKRQQYKEVLVGPIGNIRFIQRAEDVASMKSRIYYSYTIAVPDAFLINITFTNTRIPYSNMFCAFGFLSIFKGRPPCGNLPQWSIISKRSTFYFQFVLESFLDIIVRMFYTVVGRYRTSGSTSLVVDPIPLQTNLVNLSKVDVLLQGYVHALFYIKAPVDKLFNFSIPKIACEHLHLHDGPGYLARTLRCKDTVFTSTFQVFIICKTWRRMNAFQLQFMILNSKATLKLPVVQRGIFLNNHLRGDTYRRIYQLTTVESTFVSLRFLRYAYSGPGFGTCPFGGIHIYDGHSTSDAIIGAFCGRDPKTAHNLVNLEYGIVSSSNKMLVVLYTYFGYSSLLLEVKVSVSHCKGVINPCNIQDVVFILPNVILPNKYGRHCLHIQQYPPYIILHSRSTAQNVKCAIWGNHEKSVLVSLTVAPLSSSLSKEIIRRQGRRRSTTIAQFNIRCHQMASSCSYKLVSTNLSYGHTIKQII